MDTGMKNAGTIRSDAIPKIPIEILYPLSLRTEISLHLLQFFRAYVVFTSFILELFVGVLPVHMAPEAFDEFSTVVSVVDVIGMFPHIER